jgi:hypothetical protein
VTEREDVDDIVGERGTKSLERPLFHDGEAEMDTRDEAHECEPKSALSHRLVVFISHIATFMLCRRGPLHIDHTGLFAGVLRYKLSRRNVVVAE